MATRWERYPNFADVLQRYPTKSGFTNAEFADWERALLGKRLVIDGESYLRGSLQDSMQRLHYTLQDHEKETLGSTATAYDELECLKQRDYEESGGESSNGNGSW